MRRDKPRFHPLSPVQPDRLNRAPLFLLAIAAIALGWQASESFAPSSNPNTAAMDGEPGSRPAQGNLAGLIGADDYPIDALRNGETGSTRVRLDIDRQGGVSRCAVVKSSGSRSLDRSTCAILSGRARFEPARDAKGQAVEDTYTQTIVWQLQ